MLTIYTVTYNEQLMLPYFIRHYRALFPDCRIVVYDNYSTDATAKIAANYGCEVIYYNTNNQLDDLKYLEIKNHCWQNQGNDWALVVDCDELCNVNYYDLNEMELKGETIATFQGYNMVNDKDNLDIHHITKGIKDKSYSKSYLFNTKKLKEINYNPGCHVCNPVGEVKYSEKIFDCYHFKYINLAYMIDRYKRNSQRMAKTGRDKGMGSHYWKTPQAITNEFFDARAKAEEIKEPMPHANVKICVTGFLNEQMPKIPNKAHLHKVNLSNLPIGELQNNCLSEHRLFLSDEVQSLPCDFTGNLTWRYFQKCKHLLPLDNLWQLDFSDDIVWCAWLDKNWYRKSIIDHPKMQPYLDELLSLTGMSSEGTGPLANQFICHKDIYLDFCEFFRKYFKIFHEKYQYNYNFWVKDSDKNRVPAVFYERFAALYFANRTDLRLKQIPNL